MTSYLIQPPVAVFIGIAQSRKSFYGRFLDRLLLCLITDIKTFLRNYMKFDNLFFIFEKINYYI